MESIKNQTISQSVNKNFLVGVSETTHTAHYTENVVVDGIDAHLGRSARRAVDRAGGDEELEGRVVNAREVARARGLVVLRGEGKRVNVYTRRRDVGEVLVGLY